MARSYPESGEAASGQSWQGEHLAEEGERVARVGLSLLAAGYARLQAFVVAFLTGLAAPIGGLAGITLAQLTNPGTPVIYGSSSTTLDMQHATAVAAVGEVEPTVVDYVHQDRGTGPSWEPTHHDAPAPTTTRVSPPPAAPDERAGRVPVAGAAGASSPMTSATTS